MVISLVKDAVHIKMAAKKVSPLISVYEFCYAAGLALKMIQVSKEEADQLLKAESFDKFKMQIQEKVKISDVFANDPQKERLQHLLVSCRYKGQMDEESRALFWMGYL